MGIVYDPASKNAAGGTEIMLRGLEKRLDKSLANKFSIGRAIMMFKDDLRTRIFWTHNLPGQMNGVREVSEHTALNPNNRWNFLDNIVFISEWQKQKYIEHYKFTLEDQTRFKILRNAITPIPEHTKPSGTIRLIYMSVPERGLSLLYDAFEKIAPKYDVELEVFSSYKIYGIPNTDVVHRQVLDKVKSHPKIKYHGSVSNEEIHKALERAHIFAYPSTFLETSCISLIEAMSAKCLCVHSNIAALPETAAGFTNMYPFTPNRAEHLQMFEIELERAILQYQSGDISHLERQKQYIDSNYSWDVRIQEWNQYLEDLAIRSKLDGSIIDKKFQKLCNTVSNLNCDIVDHLPTLKKYADGLEHITEMGVRNVVSTWAFLAARPKKLVSIDIESCPVQEAIEFAREENIFFSFTIADTGDPNFTIEPTDLLLIDTWHIYEQLKQELELHASKVRKYIILHDTVTYGNKGDKYNFKCYVKPPKERKGLWPAIEEFIETNSEWKIKEHFTNNNGLTILERI